MTVKHPKVQALIAVSGNFECQNMAIDFFNEAMNANDQETACAVAEYVVGEETASEQFSPRFQYHCLSWLRAYYGNKWNEELEKGEENEEVARQVADQYFSIIWKHKWILSLLPESIDVSREELDEANQDIRELFEYFDISLAAIEKILMLQSIKMGDVAGAKASFQKWQEIEHDEFSDCPACEQTELVHYYNFIGKHKQAVEHAEPIISGQLTCAEVPHITYYYVIDSLWRLGRIEEAQALLMKAYDFIHQAGEEFVYLITRLVQLANGLGKKEQAEEWMMEHGDQILNYSQNNELRYLHYLIACAGFREEALIDAKKLAKDFDERNGNSYFQTLIDFMFSKTMMQ